MKDSTSKVLLSLSATDKDILILSNQRDELENERKTLFQEINLLKGKVVELEGSFREAESRRALEEHRYHEEEQRITERRRQLTALGAMKNAKLVEREIDIASRALENLQHNVHEAVQAASSLGAELEESKSKLEAAQLKFEELNPKTEEALKEISTKLNSQRKEHDTLITKVEDRLKNLYNKVNSRYPGEAVALAKSGSCRSCYRALPAQLYNQIIAGNRQLQCPGCSRILVLGDTE